RLVKNQSVAVAEVLPNRLRTHAAVPRLAAQINRTLAGSGAGPPWKLAWMLSTPIRATMRSPFKAGFTELRSRNSGTELSKSWSDTAGPLTGFMALSVSEKTA